MSDSKHRFQAPKGTRDFYPPEMAQRRWLESIWREVSIQHGFDEVDGPTFEHLDLYTVKSGEGIVNELFSFRRAGGDTDYALRPEFTPTLARMVAAQGGSLPRPIKWFCMPPMFRAERPQRGRLREHIQWNVDLLGDETPRGEAEIIAVAGQVLSRLGLSENVMRIKLSHRDLIMTVLREGCGVADARMVDALNLLDRRAKIPAELFQSQSAEIGLRLDGLARFDDFAGSAHDCRALLSAPARVFGTDLAARITTDASWSHLTDLIARLERLELLRWCEFDFSIVRGLAYYTGTVFEIHEAGGRERAVAGGGRYDKLVELFGGPPTHAIGFAMGDVVIKLVLEDNALLPSPEQVLPRPDAFVIDVTGRNLLDTVVHRLRSAGLHVRHAYRASTNVGKLLGDAGKARARTAVILGREYDEGRIVLKDLDLGTQREVGIDELERALTQAR